MGVLMGKVFAMVAGWSLLAVFAGWVMWKAICGKGVGMTKR